MLYYLGLARMSRAEVLAMTVQLHCLTGWNVMDDSLRKKVSSAKKSILGGLTRLLEGRGQAGYAGQVREAERKFNWNTETLTQKMNEDLARLSQLTEGQLDIELRGCLQKLAELKTAASDQEIAGGVLRRAALSLGIEPSCYADPAQLELVVFDAAVQRQCKALEDRLRTLSPIEQEKLAVILEGELNRLSRSEREAIRRFTGADQLSGQALLAILRTLSGVAMAKMVFAGVGFGAFLFLTTAMKATSLLLGVTLSFGTYAAATSALAALASAPALVLFAGLSGGFIMRKTSNNIGDQLAQMVIVTGYWRMADKNRT